MRRALSLLLLVLVSAALLPGCLSAPQEAPQEGPGASQSSPITPTAPVDQHGVLIVAPTVVMGGAGTSDGTLPTLSITIGPAANGDVKGLGKQEGGAQTSTQNASQTSSPTQDVSPEAIAKAATDVLAAAVPGGEAATLAAAALEAARGGDGAKAAELLARAKAAAKAEPDAPAPTKTAPAAPATTGGDQ